MDKTPLEEADQPASHVQPSVGVDADDATRQPTDRSPDDQLRDGLADEYGRIRSYFKGRTKRYRALQHRLEQAHVRTTVDKYLAESAIRSLQAAGGGAVFAFVVLTAVAVIAGRFDRVPAVTGSTPMETVMWAVLSISSIAIVCGGVTWGWVVHYRPRRLVSTRRSEIELGLPSAITFLYAMSGGGVDIITSIHALADEKAVYGEVADEFDLIAREMELFGNDLHTAIENTRDRTPSETLQQFLTNLLGVLESGGDVSRFLGEAIDEQTETAMQKQETFVDRLGLISEVFIAGFVAGPLFLIITLLVLGLLGGVSALEIAVVIYIVLPLSAVGFFLFVDLFAHAPRLTASTTADEQRQGIGHIGDGTSSVDETLADSERYRAYQQSQLRTRLRERLTNGIEYVKRRPAFGFTITVPLGVVLAAGAVLSGRVRPAATAIVAEPVMTTLWLVILPGLVTSVPVSVLYERNRRQERKIVDQFPDILETLANANRMGVTLTDAFNLVSKAGTGPLSDELTTVRNDIVWNHDPSKAFRRLAGRLPIPQVAPTLTIIAKGNRISSDLHEILEIAAEELQIHARMNAARRNEVGPYLAIVFIGSLVYLFIIVVLSVSFLDPMAAAASSSPDAMEAGPATISIDVDVFRTIFFHSALIQSIVAGLIGGKLAENNLLSGLKYAIALSVLVTGVFLAL
ncbi:flagellar protein FlaJ [Natrinema hispanicum]|uniref:Flagellar protein FlaJ n=1 Tax=Natrinema hispanicum TaxID=392421 RepID=A0A482Y284_9EURY|nr:type II secretion system F family protein [Natrinema hispanicum]RZV06320.1 flagellar protein FlaJ [Natrinema hispanicum]